jgi:hypothetical protein
MSTTTRIVAVVVAVVVIGVLLRIWFFPSSRMVLHPGNEPLVENGVAVIVACGEKRGFMEALQSAPDPQMGTWSRERRGECNAWYHYPNGGD